MDLKNASRVGLHHPHPHHRWAPRETSSSTERQKLHLPQFHRIIFSPESLEALSVGARLSRLQPRRDERCSLRLWVLFITRSLSNAVLPSAEVSVLEVTPTGTWRRFSEARARLNVRTPTENAPRRLCVSETSLNLSAAVKLGRETHRCCRRRRAGTSQTAFRVH